MTTYLHNPFSTSSAHSDTMNKFVSVVNITFGILFKGYELLTLAVV